MTNRQLGAVVYGVGMLMWCGFVIVAIIMPFGLGDELMTIVNNEVALTSLTLHSYVVLHVGMRWRAHRLRHHYIKWFNLPTLLFGAAAYVLVAVAAWMLGFSAVTGIMTDAMFRPLAMLVYGLVYVPAVQVTSLVVVALSSFYAIVRCSIWLLNKQTSGSFQHPELQATHLQFPDELSDEALAAAMSTPEMLDLMPGYTKREKDS